MKRTQDTPWMVVNVMTNEVVGFYASDLAAAIAHEGEPVDIQWRPLKRRKAGRKFP